jgi:hypothetical protein
MEQMNTDKNRKIIIYNTDDGKTRVSLMTRDGNLTTAEDGKTGIPLGMHRSVENPMLNSICIPLGMRPKHQQAS